VLYVVATPIGNLEDLTFRALRILREVDLIAAEDTRRTAKLLAHYEIRKPTVSLREHNEAREAGRLLDRLLSGERIALVSDAGTPAIADPGARLVSAAHERGITVVPIPGPSAVTAALSVAGLALSEFTFIGFPPAGGAERRAWFERLATQTKAAVFFEAPHRIRRTLQDVTEYCVKRPILVFRELTKINEELVMSPIMSADSIKEKGEFVVVVKPREQGEADPPTTAARAADLIGRLTNHDLFESEEIVRIVALVSNISERAAAKLLKKYKILTKRQNADLA
jgi:16S rRNA (cytidine1402-2'-O)-methyltransferase